MTQHQVIQHIIKRYVYQDAITVFFNRFVPKHNLRRIVLYIRKGQAEAELLLNEIEREFGNYAGHLLPDLIQKYRKNNYDTYRHIYHQELISMQQDIVILSQAILSGILSAPRLKEKFEKLAYIDGVQMQMIQKFQYTINEMQSKKLVTGEQRISSKKVVA